MTYQAELLHDRFAQAALSVVVAGRHLRQPHLGEIAWRLGAMSAERELRKGRAMSDDHLRQEASKLAKESQ